LGNDEALAVAAGDNWVAVATDTNMLRLFTVDGSQTDIFAVPGPIVCLSGFKSELFVVYHTGVGK
jgi:chromosome transmission fidelity protein 4